MLLEDVVLLLSTSPFLQCHLFFSSSNSSSEIYQRCHTFCFTQLSHAIPKIAKIDSGLVQVLPWALERCRWMLMTWWRVRRNLAIWQTTISWLTVKLSNPELFNSTKPALIESPPSAQSQGRVLHWLQKERLQSRGEHEKNADMREFVQREQKKNNGSHMRNLIIAFRVQMTNFWARPGELRQSCLVCEESHCLLWLNVATTVDNPSILQFLSSLLKNLTAVPGWVLSKISMDVVVLGERYLLAVKFAYS